MLNQNLIKICIFVVGAMVLTQVFAGTLITRQKRGNDPPWCDGEGKAAKGEEMGTALTMLAASKVKSNASLPYDQKGGLVLMLDICAMSKNHQNAVLIWVVTKDISVILGPAPDGKAYEPPGPQLSPHQKQTARSISQSAVSPLGNNEILN